MWKKKIFVFWSRPRKVPVEEKKFHRRAFPPKKREKKSYGAVDLFAAGRRREWWQTRTNLFLVLILFRPFSFSPNGSRTISRTLRKTGGKVSGPKKLRRRNEYLLVARKENKITAFRDRNKNGNQGDLNKTHEDGLFSKTRIVDGMGV